MDLMILQTPKWFWYGNKQYDEPNCDIKTSTKTHDSKAPLSPDFQMFQKRDVGLG